MTVDLPKPNAAIFQINKDSSTQTVTAIVTLSLTVKPGENLLPEVDGSFQVQFSLAPEESERKPLFETATDDEWTAFLASLAVDPAIPILSDEALDRESIYFE